ncbi:hypothetical protein [Cylindrospermopsis raciborskii]|nr:hypothetical protein [Cylindrospermopsis raciborskii]
MKTEDVHLLLVDDSSRFLDELQEWLNEYGYLSVATACINL